MKLFRHPHSPFRATSIALAITACAQIAPELLAQQPSHRQSAPQQLVPARQDPESPPASIHVTFGKLLRDRVQAGLVDYTAIRKHDAATLTGYLDRLASIEVKKLGKPEQCAFYANLYNATMIQAVLDHTQQDKDWKPSAKEFSVFKEPRVRLKSGTVTLDHLENEILRPEFKDYRVHVALVCGAVSCPPLLPRAYEGQDLDKVLDANFKSFLRDGVRNRIDARKKTALLSKLFEWFAADFGGEKGIRKLLEAEFGDNVAGYKISYLEYSWDLNEQKKQKK